MTNNENSTTNLEIEIKNQTIRIENRQLEIENELAILHNRIDDYNKLAWFFVWFGLVIAIFAIVYYCIKNDIQGFSLNLLGDFMSGTVSATWSLAGLFFIYVAFLGQKQQLLNQQLEIMYSQLEVKCTRLELHGQKQEMIDQNNTLKHQRFENTFFNLTSNFRSIVLNLNNNETHEVFKMTGDYCIDQMYNIYKRKCLSHSGREYNLNMAVSVQTLKDVYEIHMTNQFKTNMNRFCKSFYSLIDYIKVFKVENNELYLSIVLEMLPTHGLELLFYYTFCDEGNIKYKEIIEELSLLRNYIVLNLITVEHEEFYEGSAYRKI